LLTRAIQKAFPNRDRKGAAHANNTAMLPLLTDILPSLYGMLQSRVIFGVGSIEKLPAEFEQLGASRALVVSTPQQRELAMDVAARLGSRAAGVFDRAVMHVPVEVAQAAGEEARRLSADCCVAVGGGSTIGLAKAIVLTGDPASPLPILALPTSYAGSEMTPIWGVTKDGRKITGRDARVLPRTVLYDPALTVSMPAGLAATSGINAMAHCVEALYAKDATPVISAIAEEGIRTLAASLPLVVAERVGQPPNIEARSQAMFGAWLGGVSLGFAGMALHHKLCHTLGGVFNLPHAETHTVVLPHAVAYNAEAAQEAMARVARGLGTESGADSAAAGLYDLAAELGAPLSLAAIGMRAEDLDRAADLATADPYDNPRTVTREGIRELLQNAFDGRRPG
jgi:maleylacetate reductase